LFVIDWDGDGGFDEAQAGTSGFSVNHAFAEAGSYTVRASAVDPLGNWTEETTHSITISEGTIELTNVVDVYVAGSDWSATALEGFESAGMGTGGYSIMPDAGEEIETLPYYAIDTIKVLFSDDVAVSEADLQLAGVNVANYAFEPGGFSYDPATRTAVWTLAAPIGVDKLALRVSGAAEEFQLRFNVAPGDASGNGLVDIGDFTLWANTFEATGVQAADFNVDGIVTIADFTLWADYANMSLPSDEPVMPSGLVSGGGGGGGSGAQSVDAAFSDWETNAIAAEEESASALAVATSAAVVANDPGALQPADDELGWIMMCIYEKATDSGDEEEVISAAL
jgi:PKD repeat protein